MTDLTPQAREHFREALSSLADRVLDRDDAAETMRRFFDGQLALMLTDAALFVLPADVTAAALRAVLAQPADPTTPGDSPGMYL